MSRRHILGAGVYQGSIKHKEDSVFIEYNKETIKQSTLEDETHYLKDFLEDITFQACKDRGYGYALIRSILHSTTYKKGKKVITQPHVTITAGYYVAGKPTQTITGHIFTKGINPRVPPANWYDNVVIDRVKWQDEQGSSDGSVRSDEEPNYNKTPNSGGMYNQGSSYPQSSSRFGNHSSGTSTSNSYTQSSSYQTPAYYQSSGSGSGGYANQTPSSNAYSDNRYYQPQASGSSGYSSRTPTSNTHSDNRYYQPQSSGSSGYSSQTPTSNDYYQDSSSSYPSSYYRST